ncbi:MAG: hypothetical protein ACREVK_08075 [Gammaproteobacteria bacterium]
MNSEHPEGEHPELLGVRAYARLKGWAPSYICKLSKQGRLVLRDGLIDVAASNELLSQTIIPMRRGLPKDTKSPRGKRPKGSASVTFIEAKTKREWHEAQMAELKHQKQIGRLVDAEDVKRETFACVRAVRDAFLSLPVRLAPVLAAENEARRVHELLSTEIETVLQGLSDDFGQPSQNGSGSGILSSADATP